MEYRIIKGLEDPVKVRGFLLIHFYILLVIALFSLLLILGSISTCVEQGTLTPVLENLVFSVLLFISAVFVLHRMSNKKKFPPLGRSKRTTNLGLHKTLFGCHNEIKLDAATTHQLLELLHLRKNKVQSDE